MQCIHCNSHAVHSRGTTNSGKKKYQCQDCMKWFSVSTEAYQPIGDQECINTVGLNYIRLVITSAQSNTPINDKFFAAIERYVDVKSAKLIIIPIHHGDEDESYDSRIEQYLTTENLRLHPNLKMLGSLKINACAEQPLSGLDSLTKGDSVIVGHGQLALKTLAVQQEDMPVILTTTGSISEKNYSNDKQGYKAGFNHSQAAVIVELDGDRYHIRHMNFDGDGFYDFETYYTPHGEYQTGRIEALITGDEHVTFLDPLVRAATYAGKDSIVGTLSPKVIVRHDLLDCYSVN